MIKQLTSPAWRRTLLGGVVAAMTASTGFVTAAVAPAGSDIVNQGRVEYEDSSGNSYSADSANARVTVAQVYNATLEQDNLGGFSGPAQTVYFAHTITNNGNGTDVFHVSVAQRAGDDGDYSNIRAFLDGTSTASGGTVTTNNCSGANGQQDAGEVLLDDLTTAGVDGVTVTIPAGQQACLVVSAQVPAGALNGQQYDLTIQAQAEQGTGTPVVGSVDDLTPGDGDDATEDTNNDRVTITADAALQISKTAVHTPATATTNGRIDYTVTVTNTGAATAEEVFIFDGLPANTTLVPGSVLFNGSATTSGSDFLQGALTDITEANFDALVAGNANPVDLNGDGDSADTTEVDLGLDLDRDAVLMPPPSKVCSCTITASLPMPR